MSTPSASVRVGERYLLRQRLGSGGMGVVWLADDEVLRRRVAVKELHHSFGSSDRTVATTRERSLREARAAAALHHPNIVAVYDIVEHDDRPWIVMEFVPGRSLKQVVDDDGPLATGRAVEIGLQLLSALQAAHTAGITHRDVKPANVLVTDKGAVRLTDFGLATVPDTETLTETGAVLGTPGYLAPEQARGLTPGPPADVFGLGATLYYALEGVGPFHREGYLPTLVAYARHEIRPPQRAEALGPVLLRLLAADPAKRPTTEQARELLLGGAVRRPVVSRRRVLAWGAAAVATAGAVGAGTWSGRRGWTGGRATPSADSAPTAMPSPAVGLGPPAWRLDGLQYAMVAAGLLVARSGDWLQAHDLATGERRWRRRCAEGASVDDMGEGRLL
ncbi:MAG TPA: serine/threonine-protein kinase, partial [Actinoplanes sp.]|nr:serine/threonine-protein kinase [Actinoplanes sp.]